MTRSGILSTRVLVRLAAGAAGCLAAILIGGGRSTENLHLDAVQASLTAMTQVERRVIEKNLDDYRAGVADRPERQQQLTQLHTAVERDPALMHKLQSFHGWWNSLPIDDLEPLREDIRQHRTDVIQQRMADDQRRAGLIVIDFPLFGSRRYTPQRNRVWSAKEPRRGPEFLPTLELRRSEYIKLLDAAFPTANLPLAQQTELKQLKFEQDRSLLKTLLVLEQIRPRETTPLEVLQPLVEQLQSRLTDTSWRSQFSAVVEQVEARSPELTPRRGRPEPGSRISLFHLTAAVLSIPDQAVIDFSRDLLKEFEADENVLLSALESVEDRNARRELMTLPPEAALERLRRFAIRQSQDDRDPRRRLCQRCLEYEERVRTFVRTFLPPGGPGGPR